MIIVWGTRLFGKCDKVPGGMFHVATQFGHLYYIPLIPNQAYVILGQSGDSAHAVPIPVSWKSLGMAWLRTGLLLALIIGVVMMLGAAIDHSVAGEIIAIVFTLLVIGMLVATYYFKPVSHASYKRAIELAQHIGLNAESMIMIDLAYGRLDPEQASQLLMEAREARHHHPPPENNLETLTIDLEGDDEDAASAKA